MTLENATTFVDIIFVGICIFCASLLLVRRRDPGVYLPLALVFLFQGIPSLVHLIAETSGDTDRINPLMRVSVLFSMLEVACPFLFWLYVRALTSEGEVRLVPRLRYHAIPIVVTALLIASVAFMPAELNDAELPDDHPALIHAVLIVVALLLADILFKGMILAYLLLTISRLRAYQKRLREVFASTENRELTWIWMITLSAGLYWFIAVVMSVSVWIGLTNETEPSEMVGFLSSLALLVLFWIIGIWGLRQRPGLIRSPVVEPPAPETPPAQKYEKSALDHERAARIARKIESAMATDQLYREPNLCLWDLAKHISVTSHYVSQTLSTQLESSFFDYVNRWRIKDAVEQLRSTDETILVIAYDVGFNSRSAFYKAFKRETGKTPSDIRK